MRGWEGRGGGGEGGVVLHSGTSLRLISSRKFFTTGAIPCVIERSAETKK